MSPESGWRKRADDTAGVPVTRIRMYSDVGIRPSVRRKLDRDQHCAERETGIAVQRGVVTLTGTIVGHARGGAAGNAAHRVRGWPKWSIGSRWC
jgi:osmotically-inducible protein OsmY